MVLLYSTRLRRRAVTRPGSGLVLLSAFVDRAVDPIGYFGDFGGRGNRAAFGRHLMVLDPGGYFFPDVAVLHRIGFGVIGR